MPFTPAPPNPNPTQRTSGGFVVAPPASQVKPKTQPGPKLGDGWAGDLAENATRTVGEMLQRGASLPEKGLDQTFGRLINAAKGNGFTPTTSGKDIAATADTSAQKHSQSFAGKVGDVVGTVAPYLTGVGEEEGALLAPKMASTASKFLGKETTALAPKIAGYVAKKTPSLLANLGIGTAQTGDVKKGAITAVGGEILSKAGNIFKAIGKGVYKGLAVPTSATEARLLQTYKAKTPFLKRMASVLSGGSKGPLTADETAFRNGFWGTESMIGVQAKRAAGKLWQGLIGPALKRAENKVHMPTFFDEAEAEIKAQNPELSRQNSLLEALQALKEDYKDVGEVTYEDLQKFKEGWAKNVPEKAYNGKPIAGAFNDVKNIVSGIARKKIHDTLGPEARQAYFDYGNMKSLMEMGIKDMTGGKFKGGTGGFVSALKEKVLTPVGTIGGNTIYTVLGKGAEFIGPPGARYVSDLLGDNN